MVRYAKHLNRHNFISVQDINTNFCVYSRVFAVGDFKYATQNLNKAKGDAIATKFWQK